MTLLHAITWFVRRMHIHRDLELNNRDVMKAFCSVISVSLRSLGYGVRQDMQKIP